MQGKMVKNHRKYMLIYYFLLPFSLKIMRKYQLDILIYILYIKISAEYKSIGSIRSDYLHIKNYYLKLETNLVQKYCATNLLFIVEYEIDIREITLYFRS